MSDPSDNARTLSRHHRWIRTVSLAALGLAVVWFVVSPDFEPVITALFGLAGLLATHTAGTKPGTTPSAKANAAAPADVRAIAVLPLRDIGAESGSEFFADGLTEDVIAQLCRNPGLRVIAHASVRSFTEREPDRARIATLLGVGSMLQGSVRRAAGKVRVAMRLVDARTGEHRWADTYDRDLRDIFEIQSDIALRVADALRASLTPERERRTRTPPTRSVEAHDAFLLATHHWRRATEADLHEARLQLERALDLDPGHAPARARLAHWYATAGGAGFGVIAADEAVPRARQEAERALDLDPELGDAYGTLALVLGWYYWEWDRAEQTARTGVTRDPNSYLAWFSYAHVLGARGRHELCLDAVEHFVRLDPLSVATLGNAAWHHANAGKTDDAMAFAQRCAEVDSGIWGTIAIVYVHQARGEDDEAMAALERVRTDWDRIRASSGAPMFAYALGRAGRRSEFDRALGALEARATQGKAAWSELAMASMGVGDHERALGYVEKDLSQWPPGGDVTANLGVIPHLAPIRDEPRFRHALQRIGVA